jgi:glucose-1-phosphate thymidylyltransferase
MKRVGVILAGGSATRLRPVTTVVSKQLLPVYDKPVIYYPLTTLLMSGIREIALISTPSALPLYKKLFGDGSSLGIHIEYFEQNQPNGLAEAFLITESFIEGKLPTLILGDNLFHGSQFGKSLANISPLDGATIFAYSVDNPSEFGIISFDESGRPVEIIEKPSQPKSNWAVPGLYFYDSTVVEKVKRIKPSPRGELEISDLNSMYLNDSKLEVVKIPRGTAWLDLGSPDGLLDASEYVRTLQKRQGLPIGSPEEASWRQGFISSDEFVRLISEQTSPSYRQILSKALESK